MMFVTVSLSSLSVMSLGILSLITTSLEGLRPMGSEAGGNLAALYLF